VCDLLGESCGCGPSHCRRPGHGIFELLEMRKGILVSWASVRIILKAGGSPTWGGGLGGCAQPAMRRLVEAEVARGTMIMGKWKTEEHEWVPWPHVPRWPWLARGWTQHPTRTDKAARRQRGEEISAALRLTLAT